MHPPILPPSLLHHQETQLLCRRCCRENAFGMVEHCRTWPDISPNCRQREVGETAAGHETSLVGEDFSDYQLVHRPVVCVCVCVCEGNCTHGSVCKCIYVCSHDVSNSNCQSACTFLYKSDPAALVIRFLLCSSSWLKTLLTQFTSHTSGWLSTHAQTSWVTICSMAMSWTHAE